MRAPENGLTLLAVGISVAFGELSFSLAHRSFSWARLDWPKKLAAIARVIRHHATEARSIALAVRLIRASTTHKRR